MDEDIKLAELFEKLNYEFKTAKKSKFGGGVIIDEQKISEIMREISATYPLAVKEAQYVLSNREDILDKAEREADSIVQDAKDYAVRLLDEDNITKQAKIEADAIMDKAEDYAMYVHTETKKQIDELFKSTEDKLVDILGLIRDCREDILGSFVKKNNR